MGVIAGKMLPLLLIQIQQKIKARAVSSVTVALNPFYQQNERNNREDLLRYWFRR